MEKGSVDGWLLRQLTISLGLYKPQVAVGKVLPVQSLPRAHLTGDNILLRVNVMTKQLRNTLSVVTKK